MDTQLILIAFMGGGLIGLAAGAMLLLNGRIAGISGIYHGVLRPARGDTLWRWMFIAGLFAGGVILRLVNPESMPMEFTATSSGGWAMLITAGLLIGFGSRLGSGCTSGHGVCGVGRMSPRSLVATTTFVFTGMVSVFLIRHVFGG